MYVGCECRGRIFPAPVPLGTGCASGDRVASYHLKPSRVGVLGEFDWSDCAYNKGMSEILQRGIATRPTVGVLSIHVSSCRYGESPTELESGSDPSSCIATCMLGLVRAAERSGCLRANTLFGESIEEGALSCIGASSSGEAGRGISLSLDRSLGIFKGHTGSTREVRALGARVCEWSRRIAGSESDSDSAITGPCLTEGRIGDSLGDSNTSSGSATAGRTGMSLKYKWFRVPGIRSLADRM